ncbi:MAG: polysaccharide deacetylase family protein [Acidobacteria bacterium]|nr:polysaccharide deacetylase family protein [Acidobacteriota bacterium]
MSGDRRNRLYSYRRWSSGLRFGLLLFITTGIAGAIDAPPARQMAITIDDLPFVCTTDHSLETARTITTGLLHWLDHYRIPAIGFVNGNKLFQAGRPAPARADLLRAWLATGLELGNHTFSHTDLHRTDLSAFAEDLRRGEDALRPILAEYGRRLRYFRHPCLHTGRDLPTRQAILDLLAEGGCRVAPVTIDNSEWIFSKAFDRATQRRDHATAARIGEAYLEYMLAKLAYYEQQSRDLLGRDISQVLLLHANRLNARYLGALLERMAARGYRFVPLDDVLPDPAYGLPDTYTGPAGISWLHRWAITRGVAPSFFEGEPRTPDFILKLADVAAE